jgi:hypothetical protein
MAIQHLMGILQKRVTKNLSLSRVRVYPYRRGNRSIVVENLVQQGSMQFSIYRGAIVFSER